jgi:serine/threonine-protein kinase
MPDPIPSRPSADRNLLFGILALQMDFINRDALVGAMHAWVLAKDKPLGQILVEQGKLGVEEHGLLNALVQKHLQKHGNDPAQSLAAVSSLGSVEQSLRQIADPDVSASLGHVPRGDAGPPVDRYATRAPSVAPESATGLRFRILRPHAHGGLGEVYVALDDELHREVALKEIKDRYADDPESRARFVLEAEITGGLEHPGIVPVYGLGHYAEGRPYYAMRFIRGDSLMSAIERFHTPEASAASPGQRTLALRELLGRFVDVCNAIEYAHSRGVLHRDLKPGNIILGNYGETLVVDWGLAKPLEQATSVNDSMEAPLRPPSLSGSASQTQAGAVLGTPQYMSPEQAHGRLDILGPASDVYSLGATLYCLLTGKPPFTDSDVALVLFKVRQGQFPLPRKVKPEVPQALEAICLKAMAVRSADRYPTPRALAQDIERWLADEPVSAWREPWSVKARRWIGRHRPLVAGAAAAVLVATVNLTIGAVLLLRANAELRAANLRESQAKELAQQQHEKAEHNFQSARKAVDRYLTEVSEDVLLHEPGMEPLRKKLLQAAREYYDQFVQERRDDESTRAELGKALFRLAQITGDIDSEDKAIALHEQALKIFESGAGEPADLAACYHHLGRLQRKTDRLKKGEALYNQALAIWEKLDRQEPGQARWKAERARSLLGLGNDFEESRLFDRAQPVYEQALDLRGELCRRYPDNLAYQRDQAVSLSNLARVYTATGQRDKARECLTECKALQQKLVTAQPNVTQYQNDLARSHVNLADWLIDSQKTEEAAREYNQAVDLWLPLTRTHPTVLDFQTNLAAAYASLANAYRWNEKVPEAVTACRASLAIRQKLAEDHAGQPSYQADLARSWSNLGDVCRAGKQPGEADAAYQQAVALQERLTHDLPDVPQYQADLARSYHNLGLLHENRAQRELAEAAYRKALGVWEELVRAHPGDAVFTVGVANSCYNLGNLMRDNGALESALAWFTRAVDAVEKLLSEKQRPAPARQRLCDSLRQRAEVQAELKRYPEALRDWDRALPLAPEKNLAWFRLQHSFAQVRVGEWGSAVTEAEALLPKKAAAGDLCFEVARVYALCAAAPGTEAGLKQSWEKRGLELLDEARSAGFFKASANLDKLQKDSDFEALRKRDGFKQLLDAAVQTAVTKP